MDERRAKIGFRGGHRQSDAEDRATSDIAFQFNLAAVGQRDVLHNSQSQPCAPHLAASTLIDTIETLKDAISLRRLDTGAAI